MVKNLKSGVSQQKVAQRLQKAPKSIQIGQKTAKYTRFSKICQKSSKIFICTIIHYISQESNYNVGPNCFMSRGLDNHKATKLREYYNSLKN